MTCRTERKIEPGARFRAGLGLCVAGLLTGLWPLSSQADGGIDALRARSRAALARHDPIAAEVPLREALRKGASEDALRADLGAALLARDDRVEAHRILDKGDFTPDTAALGWRMRGELAMSEGHLPQAGQDFDQALKVAPGDADLWVSIARLRFTGGEEAQAQEAAERAVALAPRSARALAMRGMMVRARFGLRAGLPWFEQGLRFHPDDAGLLVEYAATLGDMGRNRDMLAAVRRLAQADPGEPRIFYLQAVLAARAGRSELARSLLQRTGTALRDLPGAMLLGGVLEYRAGNYAVAAGLLERLARLQPGNLEAQQLLARVTVRSGDNRQVVLRWDAVARQPFASPYLKVLVARSWLALGQKARGQAMLASAGLSRAGGGAAGEAGGGRGPFVSIPPDQPLGALSLRYQDAPNFAGVAVPYVRGLLAARRGDQARVVADRLRDANPGASQAWLVAGDVRMLGGDPRGAVAQYEQAATIRFGEPVLRRLDAALRASGQPRTADTVTARYLDANPQSLAAMRLLLAAWREEGRMAEAAAMERALRARGV